MSGPVSVERIAADLLAEQPDVSVRQVVEAAEASGRFVGSSHVFRLLNAQVRRRKLRAVGVGVYSLPKEMK